MLKQRVRIVTLISVGVSFAAAIYAVIQNTAGSVAGGWLTPGIVGNLIVAALVDILVTLAISYMVYHRPRVSTVALMALYFIISRPVLYPVGVPDGMQAFPGQSFLNVTLFALGLILGSFLLLSLYGSDVPAALIFALMSLIAAVSNRPSLIRVVFYITLVLALLAACYGLLLAIQKKRTLWLITSDIIALGYVVYIGWLYILAAQTFSHWPAF